VIDAPAHPAARPSLREALRRTPAWSLALAAAVGAAMWLTPLPPVVVPALLCGVIGLGLMLRWPVLGVYALILSVPVQKLVTLGGLTVTQILIGVVLLVWWAGIMVRRSPIVVPPLAWGLILYLLAMAVSLLEAKSLGDGIAEMYRWVVVLAAYLLAVNLVRTRREIAALVASFLVAAGGEAALGLAQTALGLGPESFVVADAATRSYGTIGMPNSYGGYLNLTLPLVVALAAWAVFSLIPRLGRVQAAAAAARDTAGEAAAQTAPREAWRHAGLTMTLLGAAALIGVGVVTSFSRGAWLGLVVGLTAMILALGRRGLAALAALSAGGVVAVLLSLYGALPAVLVERLGSISEQFRVFDVRGVVPTPETWAQIERLAHWQTAMNMAQSSPLFGVGVGNFNARFNDFYLPGWRYSQGHAHNYYLHTWGETGIAGLSAYLLLLVIALAGGLWAVRRVRGVDQALVVGALGVLVTFMTHNIFENLHVLNLGIHWAAVLALFVAVPRAANAECRARSAEYDEGSGIRDQGSRITHRQHATRDTQHAGETP
jgi:O-antigen ligase